MGTDAEYEAIQREMAIARRELYEDARSVVKNAKELTDWRHYVREYPWLSVGAAFAVGYLVVPSVTLALLPGTSSSPPPPLAAASKQRPPTEDRSSWTSSALAFASSAALRLAMAYAGQQLGNWLENQATSNGSASSH